MTNVLKDPASYANEIIVEFNGDAPAALAAYIESMAWELRARIARPVTNPIYTVDGIVQGRRAPLSYMTAVRDLLADACSN